MQMGRNVADILLFYGEDTNATAEYGGEWLSLLPKIPVGYNFDYANPHALLHAVRPEGGCLVTDSGQRYRVLVLGPACKRYLSEEMRGRIEALKAQGVPVCYEEELPQLLEERGIGPDVVLPALARKDGLSNWGFLYGGLVPQNKRGHDAALAGLQYVHRTAGADGEIYWLCNFTGQDWQGRVSFREGGPCAALFNAETGRMERIPGGRDGVDLRLKAGDAVFVVLTDRPLDLPEARPAYKASELLTLDRWWDVSFSQKGGEKALETFSQLNDWTSNSDPVVKYFSGTALYRSAFNVPAGALDELKSKGLRFQGVGFTVAAITIVPGPPQYEGTVIWDTETAFADWSATILIGADKFADAKAGDVVRVYIKDKGGDYNPIFKHENWSDWTEFQSQKVDGDGYFEAPIPDGAMDELLSTGLRFQGVGFTIVKVTLLQ